MLKQIGSAIFYARFARSFSALGYRRRAAGWPPFQPEYGGQTWLVTGATGGIGRAVALAAVRHGARVLAVARDADKLAALQAASPQQLIPLQTDLASVAEVRALAASVAEHGKLDILVNNVGVLLNQHQRTEEGLERSFATNLLNHYLLSEALQSSGLLRADGMLINVSSGGMYGTPLQLDGLAGDEPREYDGMAAYAMHKRAQVELTRYWNQQWKGAPCAQVMHPGWVDTEGVRSSLPGFRAVMRRILRNSEQGAECILWLAHQRPPAPAQGGIWLDRELQPEHAFSFTRNSRYDGAALVAFLQARLAAVG